MLQSQCPHCGTLNRAGAKFCARCQTPLSYASARACPECHTPNRVDAKFCTKCGYAFSAGKPLEKTAAPVTQSNRLTVLIVGAVIASLCIICIASIATLILTGNLRITTVAAAPTVTATLATTASVTPSVSPSASPTSSPMPSPSLTASPTRPVSTPTLTSADALERAKRGTVSILVPRDSDRNTVAGSGSVITLRGHILTNNHIVADQNGKLYNTQSRIYVAFPPRDNLKGSVEIYYRATLVRNDLKNDLALLKITALKDGGALPADLGLVVIPVGDSDKVDSGNEVTILGYPGLGGDTLTITRGIISGFLLDDGYIKTDAEINSGNSGGPAFNLLYEQIGIASAAKIRDTSASVPGKLGLIRPINLARALIELAKREAGE